MYVGTGTEEKNFFKKLEDLPVRLRLLTGFGAVLVRQQLDIRIAKEVTNTEECVKWTGLLVDSFYSVEERFEFTVHVSGH
jgi:hypothetical protein